MSPTAEWVAYAAAQLEWVEEQAPEDLVYGIPDHDPALWIHAWETALGVRERLQQEGRDASDPFLERMLEVRAAGFLAEYVLSEYYGFLPPPSEPRRETFERWRAAAIPAHRHALRAAAYLHAGD